MICIIVSYLNCSWWLNFECRGSYRGPLEGPLEEWLRKRKQILTTATKARVMKICCLMLCFWSMAGWREECLVWHLWLQVKLGKLNQDTTSRRASSSNLIPFDTKASFVSSSAWIGINDQILAETLVNCIDLRRCCGDLRSAGIPIPHVNFNQNFSRCILIRYHFHT